MVHALALLDLGAVIVPLQAGASADRCAQVAQQLDVVGWVGKVGSVPALEQGILRSEEDLAWWRPERDPLPPSQDLDGLAFIRFTSGTTDAARGVALTHESIRARHRAANEVLGLGAELLDELGADDAVPGEPDLGPGLGDDVDGGPLGVDGELVAQRPGDEDLAAGEAVPGGAVEVAKDGEAGAVALAEALLEGLGRARDAGVPAAEAVEDLLEHGPADSLEGVGAGEQVPDEVAGPTTINQRHTLIQVITNNNMDCVTNALDKCDALAYY